MLLYITPYGEEMLRDSALGENWGGGGGIGAGDGGEKGGILGILGSVRGRRGGILKIIVLRGGAMRRT
jgi:hypothetical protein